MTILDRVNALLKKWADTKTKFWAEMRNGKREKAGKGEGEIAI